MKASLPNYHQAPRKVRLLADLVRGKSVPQALAELSFAPKRAAGPLAELIKSAAANASNTSDASRADLIVKNVQIDKGLVMRRWRPRARGRAAPIRHRMSHIKVTLALKSEAAPKKAKKAVAKKAAPKRARKTAATK